MTAERAAEVAEALRRAIVPRAAAQPADDGTFEVFVALPARTPAGHLERALRVARAMNCEVWLERDPLGLRLVERTARPGLRLARPPLAGVGLGS